MGMHKNGAWHMKPGSNGASNPLIVLIKMVAGARNSYCSHGLECGFEHERGRVPGKSEALTHCEALQPLF
jgi:hypothetical protein